eukprot:CAMPEP_0176488036 /NCGR_PEP_ID=MMETSP0200_2-20121128/6477_1 /TAXON_ID=947934 /ORGANISM="Chaetoceros sp., Strain GSL56" /LENGTH=564 /DNA_ID=CAMNT_0017884957 /DNA_START=400 /DNA_END=2094 /DNA_ORIENTATION=-
MSDNILGYNPMSNTSPIYKNPINTTESKSAQQQQQQQQQRRQSPSPSSQGPWIGVDSNTEGGGVWAQTNAKRDKLGELRLELRHELGQRTLDDAATMEEKLDNYLVDGIKVIACLTDGKELSWRVVGEGEGRGVSGAGEELGSVEMTKVLDDFDGLLLQEFAHDKQFINRQEYESHLLKLIEHVEQIKVHHVAVVSKPSPLISIRDMLAFVPPLNEDISQQQQQQQQQQQIQQQDVPLSVVEKEISSPIAQDFTICSEYYRILLLEACLKYLITKWDDIVKIVDADMDRAAATGCTLTVSDTIDVVKLHQVIQAFARHGCSERVRALWEMMDKDNDGLLNQVEMDEVITMSIKPVEDALSSFVKDCVSVWPLRRPIPEVSNDHGDVVKEIEMQQEKKGRYQMWKEQRVENKAQKTFMKLFQKAIKRHFDIDVEVAHRLRCCYAWAEKKHQDGKVTSILIDGTSGAVDVDGHQGSGGSAGAGAGLFGGGRTRYVELDPKISYVEFREVQKSIFPHLDRVSEEFCNGFKEELWILQGTRRQNAVLKRESLAFLAVVSLLDLGITLS